MSGAVDRITNRAADWQAWAGSTEDLRRIGAVMAKLSTERRDKLMAQWDSEHPPPPPDSDKSKYLPFDHEFRRNMFKDEIDDAFALRVSLIEQNTDVISGKLDEVLAEFDRRRYVKFEFSGNRYHQEEFELTLQRNSVRPGAMFRVSSNDSGWTRQAFTAVKEEVERGSQSWGWFRTYLGFATFLAITAVLFGVFVSQLLRAVGVEGMWYALVITLPLSWALAVSELTKAWIFPPLDIIGEGEKPRGSRVLPVVGGTLFSALVGIAVNVATG